MRKYADDITFKMELSPEKVKSTLADGVIDGKNYIIAPVKINDDAQYSPYNPYNFGKRFMLFSAVTCLISFSID